MQILLDYRPALRARTGVGEYMHEIIRAYTSEHDDDVAAFTSSWRDRPAPDTAAKKKGTSFWRSKTGASILIVGGAIVLGFGASALSSDNDDDDDDDSMSPGGGTGNTPN